MQALEAVIRKGWATFLEVGAALATILREKLYRAKYGDDFNGYCRQELGISRPYAYNLLGSAEVYTQLSSIEDMPIKPATESQCRELLSVPEKKRPDAWRGALKLAGSAPVTAKIVREAAAPFRDKKPGTPPARKSTPTGHPELGPALELLARAEKAAGASQDEPVLKELRALRKCLEGLAKG